MNKLILILSAFFAITAVQTTWAAKKATCEICIKVEKMLKAYEDDESKAYDEFNEFMATVKLSTEQKMMAEELKSIVNAVPTFLKSDGPRELPDYLVDMEEAHPKEFAAAIKGLAKADQENIERKMKIAKDVMKNGEESGNVPEKEEP